MDSPKIRRALISVSDKNGLVDFAKRLVACDVEIVSSGGTYKMLQEAGIAAVEVSEYTGFPEMMDGRLKTLHPKVHGGILCRHDRTDDMSALKEHGITPFELVVVNLYPFAETIAKPNVTFEEAIEQIDIGGPTLVRAAAKNHKFTTIVSNASQYDAVCEQLEANGETTLELRKQFAADAFSMTAKYDTTIDGYFASLANDSDDSDAQSQDDLFPAEHTIQLKRSATLRYGENPHQAAALYINPQLAASPTLATAEQLHGKELSYNNYLDLDAAWKAVRSLPDCAAVVLKHNNPCGAACGETMEEAITKAWAGDPVSAFGSVLGFNGTLDEKAAEFLCEPGRFVEAIIAPDFDPAAIECLTTKPKWKANVRLIRLSGAKTTNAAVEYRAIDGGFLSQQADDLLQDQADWKVVTEAQPSEALAKDLAFAWAAIRPVKSNAILLAKDRAIIGVGAGQMSRVDSVEIAIRKAGENAAGTVLASDAFFPFDDSIHVAAKAGVKAIIQPGGSRRDNEVIAACNEHNLPMIFTSRRHFKH